MEQNKIINCSQGVEENDVCTMKNLSNYYRKGGTEPTDAVNRSQVTNLIISNFRNVIMIKDRCTTF